MGLLFYEFPKQTGENQICESLKNSLINIRNKKLSGFVLIALLK